VGIGRTGDGRRAVARPDIALNRHYPPSARAAPATSPCSQCRSHPCKLQDTFLSLLKTCTKLAVSFWDYLGARLKIPEAEAVPWLPDLIRQRAPA
jgi:hypothetical protein